MNRKSKPGVFRHDKHFWACALGVAIPYDSAEEAQRAWTAINRWLTLKLEPDYERIYGKEGMQKKISQGMPLSEALRRCYGIPELPEGIEYAHPHFIVLQTAKKYPTLATAVYAMQNAPQPKEKPAIKDQNRTLARGNARHSKDEAFYNQYAKMSREEMRAEIAKALVK